MGERGRFTIVEKGVETGFYSHWGGYSPLSALYTLNEAIKLYNAQFTSQSSAIRTITELFGSMDTSRQLTTEVGKSLFRKEGEPFQKSQVQEWFDGSDLQILGILDLDRQEVYFAFNQTYYREPKTGAPTRPEMIEMKLNEAMYNIEVLLALDVEEQEDPYQLFDRRTGIER